MNVLQQITADIHGIVNLIRSETFTIKDQQEGNSQNHKEFMFSGHIKEHMGKSKAVTFVSLNKHQQL